MSAAEQYITNEKGNKVAVILPLIEYQHLKEDLHDLAMVAGRRHHKPGRIKKACDVSGT
jgi:hypothetical protein